MQKSTLFRTKIACLVLSGFILNLGLSTALAQPIVPATDGTDTQVIPEGNQFNIQGGQFSNDGANLFHSFQKFGLSEGQIANFLSNPNIRNIIGRINGGEASLINGLIQVLGGNSNLYLMNPAGIVFGANAQLNVPAAFTATSATGIGFGNNNWFHAVGENHWSALVGMPNQFRFDTLNPGSIVNFGNLAVGTGESLTLLGGSVLNLGTLEAPGGRITVAAVPGQNLIRISQEGHLLSVELPLMSEGERQLGITPLSLPQLLAGANIGNANTVSVNAQGQVVLTGSGISIPDKAGTAIASGTVSSGSQESGGGEIHVLGDRIALVNAHLNASGAKSGGTIFIGGNRSGLGPLPNAQYTFVSADSAIAADALQQGNGGEIIVFAQDTAQVYGTLTARGGLLGGNGGFIETSGMRSLTITTVPNVGATAGLGGEWLIDPTNITIVPGNGNTNINAISPFESSGDSAQLGVDLITTALNTGDVTISTGAGGTQVGDIILSTPLTFNLATERTLTLNAHSNIFINQPIGGTAGSAPLNVILNGNSGNLATSISKIAIFRPINTQGGDITIQNFGVGDSGILMNGSGFLNSSGGDINLTATASRSTPSPILQINSGGTINTGGGNLTITGTNTSGSSIGVAITDSQITIPGNGNITVNGNGDTGLGIIMTNNRITVENGTLTINGNSNFNNGILFNVGSQLTATGAGNIRINVAGGNGGLLLTGATQVRTNNGNITLNSSGVTFVSGSSQLTVTGNGNITLNSTGSGILIDTGGQLTTTGGATTLTTGNRIRLSNSSSIQSTSGAITLDGTGGVVLNSNSSLQSASGAITLTSNEITLSDGNINPTPGSGNISLAANEINLIGTSQVRGTGAIAFQPLSTNADITIGGTTDNSGLNLDNSDLASVQSGFSQIIIGSPDNTGTIILDDTATFNAPVLIAGGATLVGPNRNTTWTITGNDSVSLSGYPNGLTANNIQNLKGGILDDNFAFNDGQNWGGTIDGDAGIDTLDYAAFTTPLTVDIAALGATGIETVVGTTNATSTLIGTNTNNTWNITETNGGTLNNTLNFRNFQNLVGGTLDDNFVFNDGVNWRGTIEGNTGTDALNYSAFTTDLTVDLAALGATGIETVTGTTNATSTLIGTNANNTWNLTGTNSGNLNNTLNFIQFQNIVGGNLEDTFILGDGIAWNGRIDGSGGTDTLDYSTFAIPINIELATLNAVNIETIVGTTNATSNLIATNINNNWEITNSNSGRLNNILNFRNFQRLTGGNLEDNFIFSDGANWGGIIDGNSGTNTLNYSAFTVPLTVELATLSNTAININHIIGTTNATSTLVGTNESNNWTITGNNSGRFNNTLNFSNFQRMVGGNLNDDFVFNDGINWTGTIDGGNGSDTLNYAAFTRNLIVNLEALEATSIENIIGTNNAASTLIGRNETNTWNLTGNNSGTYNGTLNFSQFQNLTGGNQADTFIFNSVASISGNIDGSAGTLTLRGDEVNFAGTVSGTGDLFVEPLTLNQDIQVGGTDSGSNSVLDLTSAELNLLQNGFRSITIGGTNSSGTIILAGNVTFQEPVTLQTLGAITYRDGTLRGADNATLTLTARGDVTTGSIINPGRSISITSQQGQINTTAGIIDTSSGTDDGGAIALTSELGSITTGNINSSGITSGGNIVFQALTAITAGEINSSATIGNAGNVTLDPIGDVEVSSINAQGGTNGSGGNVFIVSTGGFFRATNSFATPFSPTGTASISTAGGLGGGSITIQHAGGDETLPIQPFVIGSQSPNGTAAAITTGTFTLFPGESFPRAFNLGNIGLVTDNGTPSVLPDTIPDTVPETVSDNIPETVPDTIPETVSDNIPETVPDTIPETVSDNIPETVPDTIPDTVPETVSDNISETVPDTIPDTLPETVSDNISETVPDTIPDTLPERVSDTLQSPPSSRQDNVDERVFIAQKNPLYLIGRDTFVVDIDASVIAIEKVLTREFEAYFSQPPVTPITKLADIQQQLRRTEEETGIRSALIYTVFGRNRLGDDIIAVCTSREESGAREDDREQQQCDRAPDDPLELLLVAGNGKPMRLRVPQAQRQVVQALVKELRTEIANPYKRQTTSYLNAAQKLYNFLIAPIEPTLKAQQINNLVFVPDAGLRSLPFAALHDGQTFLVEQYSLALIPSFSLSVPHYVKLQQARVLGMGASEFREQSPLPFVPDELTTITSKLGQSRLFLNENFTLNNLKAQRTQQPFEIIHLATHAEFKTGVPSNSYIQLWDTRLRLPQMHQLKWSKPPVELLVLSACRTALGDEQAELGFAGLSVQAGVRSAVASLWYASDQGTLALMATFYQSLQQAPIRAEALRQAQIALLRSQVRVKDRQLHLPEGTVVELTAKSDAIANTDFSHPYYWAAFELIGNPW